MTTERKLTLREALVDLGWFSTAPRSRRCAFSLRSPRACRRIPEGSGCSPAFFSGWRCSARSYCCSSVATASTAGSPYCLDLKREIQRGALRARAAGHALPVGARAA